MTPDVQVGSFALPEWAIGLLALILTGAAQFVFRFVLNRKLAARDEAGLLALRTREPANFGVDRLGDFLLHGPIVPGGRFAPGGGINATHFGVMKKIHWHPTASKMGR
jgi:hypothetical protein